MKREQLKSLIRDIRRHEHEADHYERELITRSWTIKDPLQVFYLILLVETIGSIADHAQNASSMMRAMLSKQGLSQTLFHILLLKLFPVWRSHQLPETQV